MRRAGIRTITVVLIVAGALCVAAWAYHRAQQRPVVPQNSRYVPPQEWLEKKLGEPGTVEWHGQTEPEPGDEVWSFRSPPESWKQLMGTGGVCLVRRGKIVDGYVTVVN
jgi:hypothetical protein